MKRLVDAATRQYKQTHKDRAAMVALRYKLRVAMAVHNGPGRSYTGFLDCLMMSEEQARAIRRGLLLVHSVGGVGTSTFFSHFAPAAEAGGLVLNSGADHDDLKHQDVTGTMLALQRLPAGCRRLSTVVYLLGDPAHAVVSLYRRNYYHTQADKLRHDLRRAKCFPLVTEIRAMPLAEYARSGLDLLALGPHLADWLLNACRAPVRYPTVFADRSSLWRHIDELAAVLQINASLIDASERVAYTHAHEDLEHEQLTEALSQRLTATYEPLRQLYQRMGEFYVLDARSCQQPKARALLQLARNLTYPRATCKRGFNLTALIGTSGGSPRESAREREKKRKQKKKKKKKKRRRKKKEEEEKKKKKKKKKKKRKKKKRKRRRRRRRRERKKG